jgi:hypothetical protein
MSELLHGRWTETKEALLEGLQGTKKSVMGVTLDNTRKYLLESPTAGATSAGNVATLNRVILPVIRRVMPTVIANELVGVQPMTGPVGQIHTLRVRYADNGNGVVAGEEALSPFKIAESYSGNNATPGKAASTATLEGAAGKRMSIQILKQTVEAKTRKLSARWTFEAAQDAQAQQGIDVEAEIMAALAQEITAEIDQEILASLASLAGTATESYEQQNVSGTATFVGDEHAALAVQIFYCPYIPLMSSGVVLDPSTFEPVVSFMTRYGYVELSNTASSLGNAADYLGKVAIQNVVFR